MLIDRPGSPQSVIYGGEMTPLDPRSDIDRQPAGSDVLGGGTFSRINDLRETKGWAYSPYSVAAVARECGAVPDPASVQADRTGDSIAELMSS